jgi:hypothetical protein
MVFVVVGILIGMFLYKKSASPATARF